MKTTKISDNELRDAELLAVLNSMADNSKHRPLSNAARTGFDRIVEPRKKRAGDDNGSAPTSQP